MHVRHCSANVTNCTRRGRLRRRRSPEHDAAAPPGRVVEDAAARRMRPQFEGRAGSEMSQARQRVAHVHSGVCKEGPRDGGRLEGDRQPLRGRIRRSCGGRSPPYTAERGRGGRGQRLRFYYLLP